MGAAKRRGTFEERKATAIKRNQKERERRMGLIAKYENPDFPAQTSTPYITPYQWLLMQMFGLTYQDLMPPRRKGE